MQKYAVLFFLFLCTFSRASHNRSGEITYKRIEPYTKVVAGTTVQAFWYAIRVVKYTDDDTQPIGSAATPQIADKCIIDTLFFGDGTFTSVTRINGGTPVCIGCQGCGCANCGELIIIEAGYRVKKNIYECVHEYPATGSFLIRTADPYRNAGVHNMNTSAQQAFYLESLLVINPFSGPNNSPEFTVDPIDKACRGKCFTHNPGAYDPDHDSLSYKISTPKRALNSAVLGYTDPATGGGTFNINARSGILTWCTPQDIGEYNIAFVVEEWRKNTSGSFQLTGTVLRDMQVVVRSCASNDPPIVIVPQDTCVEAGTLIHKKIQVSDPNTGDVVTVTGHGGAFSAPAPQGNLSNTSGNNYFADFSWQTSCDHVAQQYYQTTFRAEDNSSSGKMATYNVYNIRVVPPSVKDVTTTPAGTTMKIGWSLSTCNPTNNPLIAYKVYRKEGCDPFVNEPCQVGIPASSGFVLIGETDNKTSFFIDNNGGDGLVVGQNYSYLIVSVYKDGSRSFGSSQVCAKLKRDVPIFLNVDVLSTSVSTGSIHLRWSPPLKTPGNLDVVAFPGPYRLDLKSKYSGTYQTIFTSTANDLDLLATDYNHLALNTTLDSNQYYLEFTATGTIIIGESQKATSLFLTATGSDRKIDLQWKSKTPWKNYTYTVFRKSPSATNYTAIGTTTLTSFSDKDHIVNKSSYCYYILSEGAYSDPSIDKPLLNKSQEVCVMAEDHTAPCSPTLSVDADCPSGFVTVRWKNVRSLCSDDVINYVLYYKNTVDDSYQKVFETDTTYYIYDGLSLISGCYAIQAEDSAGNRSAMSPDFCIDNCPEFELPNIFSPNKDGANDFFKAVKVRQIKEIDLAIVDRWGNLLYKTKDPYFQWDGASIQSKESVSDGTLFYVCTVYEPRVKGIVKRILKGTIQVVR